MVLVGAEFIAMLLVIVYVGAVAVLFLFVVMMLDVDFAELRAAFRANLPLGISIALVLLAELVFGIGAAAGRIDRAWRADARSARVTNTEAHRRGALYTDYIFLFQAAGLVLLVAMIGAIVLTLRSRRRQDAEHHRSGRRAGRRKTRQPSKSVKSARGVDL